MCLEVEKYLKLNYIPGKKKVNLKKELEQVWEQTGIKPTKLIELEPQIPSAGRDLWTIFWELKIDESINWTEVYNYCWFNEIDLNPNEVQIIMAMNSEYNKYIHDVEMPKQNAQINKTKGK